MGDRIAAAEIMHVHLIGAIHDCMPAGGFHHPGSSAAPVKYPASAIAERWAIGFVSELSRPAYRRNRHLPVSTGFATLQSAQENRPALWVFFQPYQSMALPQWGAIFFIPVDGKTQIALVRSLPGALQGAGRQIARPLPIGSEDISTRRHGRIQALHSVDQPPHRRSQARQLSVRNSEFVTVCADRHLWEYPQSPAPPRRYRRWAATPRPGFPTKSTFR